MKHTPRNRFVAAVSLLLRRTWQFGSPDVTPMFSIGIPHVTSDNFDASLVDFSGDPRRCSTNPFLVPGSRLWVKGDARLRIEPGLEPGSHLYKAGVGLGLCCGAVIGLISCQDR